MRENCSAHSVPPDRRTIGPDSSRRRSRTASAETTRSAAGSVCSWLSASWPGRLAQRVGLAADVLQVVDVLEQSAVAAHRVAQRRGKRTSGRLVGQRERRLEQRHRLAVDHVPVARGRRAERLEDLAVGDAAQRVTEREPARRRHRVGEVQRLGVQRVGGPERDRHAERDVERRRVPAERRAVDDVVVHQRAQVQQLDRGRALHRLPCGRRRRASSSSRRARCRDPDAAIGSERTGDGLAERRDHAFELAVDVGEQGSLVHHTARDVSQSSASRDPA